jgi:hypothetical protein
MNKPITFKSLLEISYSEAEQRHREGYYFTHVQIKQHLHYLNNEIENLNKYYNILFSGALIGYKIKCPNCGIIYKIDTMINRENINCMDCNYEYNQCKNITCITYEE